MSRQIYQKHQRAIDLIYEHRFAQQDHVRRLLEKLIREAPELSFDKTRGDKINFGVHEWDTPALLTGDGWSRSKRILTFEFWNFPRSLDLALFVTQGEDRVRQKLFDMVSTEPEILEIIRNWEGGWSLIFARKFLGSEMYETVSDNEREAEIRKNWDDFLKNDLPRIDAALKRETWIWEPEEPEDSSGSSNRFTWGNGDIAIKRPGEDRE